MHANGVSSRTKSELVCLPDRCSRLDTGAGHPDGISVNVVIAADGLALLPHGSAAELSAPDDQCLIEQPAPLEIVDKRGRRAVDFPAHLVEAPLQILSRPAVVVPVGVVELDEPDASFDQTARQQAVVGKRAAAGLGSIELEGFFAFAREVHKFRSARLHPVSHLVGRNSRRDLRVAGFGQPCHVQVPQHFQRLPLPPLVESLGARQIQDRVADGAKRHALVRRRQKAASPVRGAPARAAWPRLEDNEARQILGFAPQAVRDPRAHARPSKLRTPGVGKNLCRRVIENFRRHGAHEGHVIHNRRNLGKAFRHPGAALTALRKLPPRSEHLRNLFGERVHESKALPLDEGLRNGLTVELLQFRFVVEKLQLARASGHEEINDAPGPWRKVGFLRRERVRKFHVLTGERSRPQEERGERHLAQAQGALFEKVPPGPQKHEFVTAYHRPTPW